MPDRIGNVTVISDSTSPTELCVASIKKIVYFYVILRLRRPRVGFNFHTNLRRRLFVKIEQRRDDKNTIGAHLYNKRSFFSSKLFFHYRNIGDENYTQQPSRIHSDIADVNDLRLRTSKQTSGTRFPLLICNELVDKVWC